VSLRLLCRRLRTVNAWIHLHARKVTDRCVWGALQVLDCPIKPPTNRARHNSSHVLRAFRPHHGCCQRFEVCRKKMRAVSQRCDFHDRSSYLKCCRRALAWRDDARAQTQNMRNTTSQSANKMYNKKSWPIHHLPEILARSTNKDWAVRNGAPLQSRTASIRQAGDRQWRQPSLGLGTWCEQNLAR
jgi:hypothetical protein